MKYASGRTCSLRGQAVVAKPCLNALEFTLTSSCLLLQANKHRPKMQYQPWTKDLIGEEIIA